MDPRLKSSTKWTPFPQELTDQIKDVMNKFFADYDLGGGEFVVEGFIYPEEIVLRLGLSRSNQLRQDNFEASMQYVAENDKSLDVIYRVIDFLGQTWQDYLEEPPEDENLPRQWVEHSFENRPIFLRYSTENTKLEAEANRLLQELEKQLVYESPDAELTEEQIDAAFESENTPSKETH